MKLCIELPVFLGRGRVQEFEIKGNTKSVFLNECNIFEFLIYFKSHIFKPQTKAFKPKFYKIKSCDIKLPGKGRSFFFLKRISKLN